MTAIAITAPAGVQNSMSYAEYDRIDAVRSGMLKEIAHSPAHCFARYLDANRPDDTASPGALIGLAYHCAMLEGPDELRRRYPVLPAGTDRRTKAGKAAYDNAMAAGAQPMSYDAAVAVRAMVAATHRLRLTRDVFAAGVSEQTVIWTDEETGLHCKARFDHAVAPCERWPVGLVADLKSTHNAQPSAFSRSAYDLGYHIQRAFYAQAFKAAYRVEAEPEFRFLAIEQTRPYVGKWLEPSADFESLGYLEMRRTLALYAECQRTGIWPGYDDYPDEIELPFYGAARLQHLLRCGA